jgi:hypothetical protein
MGLLLALGLGAAALGACKGSAGALPNAADFAPPSSTTSVAGGSTTPSTAGSAVAYPPTAAYSFEIGVRSHVGGCWAQALPGDRSGSYRQDLYYQSGPCSGTGWSVAVEIYNSASPPSSALPLLPAGAVYRDSNTLVVVAPAAPAAVSRLVASTGGLTPVSR